MNILEQADKYAEGKANEAITKAIADAYIEGYKAGYKDREEEIPYELRDDKTEYIDLGLPSRTLWSTNYEKTDNDLLYLPYDKAAQMKLPTKEQWKELLSICKWEYEWNYSTLSKARCIGPNGQTIFFYRTGMRNTQERKHDEIFFWIEDNYESSDKTAAHIYNAEKQCNNRRVLATFDNYFSGYMLPVRTVR